MTRYKEFLSHLFPLYDLFAKQIIVLPLFTFVFIMVSIYPLSGSFVLLQKGGQMNGDIIRAPLKENIFELKYPVERESLISKKKSIPKTIPALKQSGSLLAGTAFRYGKRSMDKIVLTAQAKKEDGHLMKMEDEHLRNPTSKSRNTVLIFSFVIIAIVIASLFTILSELQKRTTVEKLLKTVLDSSLSGIQSFKSIRDLTGKIIDFKFIQANTTSYKMLSAPAYSYVGKTLTQVSPHLKSHELFEEYIRVVETGLPLNTEHYYNYDGINGWYRIIAVKLEDGFTVTFDDITEAKRIKLELENNVKALKHSNEELEQFANIASHDLQEPLRKILAFIDRLKIKNADLLSEESKSYFDRIVNSAYRMRTLINDLLSYSRLGGNGQLETVPVDLNKQLKEVLSDLEMVIQQKKGNIFIGELPVIEGREVQLRQLFQNLVSNSLKFSDPLRPPVIEIASEYIGHPNGQQIPVTEVTPDSFCKIDIRDNGIGFEGEDADKIFRIFYRLHGRSEYEGSGIGLAICKKIVDNHHGTIIANGNPGVGSSFTIVLPLKQRT